MLGAMAGTSVVHTPQHWPTVKSSQRMLIATRFAYARQALVHARRTMRSITRLHLVKFQPSFTLMLVLLVDGLMGQDHCFAEEILKI